MTKAVPTGQKQRKAGGRPFTPGHSGNPAGRPLGSRQKLAENFLAKMAADFDAEGEAAIVRVRTEDPSTYLKVIASLIPKEVGLTDADGGPLQIVIRRMTPDDA